MTSISIPYEPMKKQIAQQLLPNCDPWTLWWLNFNCHFNGQKKKSNFFFTIEFSNIYFKIFNSNHFIWMKFIGDN
jgi:hypothetical protein